MVWPKARGLNSTVFEAIGSFRRACRTVDIEPGKPAQAGPGRARITFDRTRQHRGQRRRLIGRQIPRWFTISAAAAGLDSEFAVRAPFGDVEVDFQHPPL